MSTVAQLPIGDFGPMDRHFVIAQMTHPADSKARHGFFNTMMAYHAGELTPRLDPKVVMSALQYGGTPAMESSIEGAYSDQVLAGGVLIYFLRHAMHHAAEGGRKASLAKAMALAARAPRVSKTGKVASGAATTIARTAWSKYGSVAHLCWARDRHDDSGDLRNLRDVLGRAEMFRRAAIDYGLAGADEMVTFEPAAPADVAFVRGLTPSDLDDLANYKAEKKR